jgi:hypothetical protein
LSRLLVCFTMEGTTLLEGVLLTLAEEELAVTDDRVDEARTENDRIDEDRTDEDLAELVLVDDD